MAKKNVVEFVLRPFEGLPGEADWVCLREVVPAATATARTTAEYGARDVVITTVLPAAWPALHRGDGTIMVALQQHAGSGDASRDLADLLLQAIDLPVGTPITTTGRPEPGPRLQDVLDLTVPFEVTMHDSFDFWTAAGVELPARYQEQLDQLNETIVPSAKLTSVPAAYWARMGDKEFLRWGMTKDEDLLVNAFARLHARREAGLGGGEVGKLVGMFRSCGLLVPVWDLAWGTEPQELDEPVADLAGRLAEAIEVTDPLTFDERRARSSMLSRQVTLR